MKTLQRSLLDYPVEMLQGMAELRDVHLVSRAQPEIVDQLAAALSDRHSISAAVDGCSAEAQAALRDLISSGGRMTSPAFARSHGEVRTFGPGRMARETPWRQTISAAEELWYRGLIARGFAPLGDGSAEFIFVPSDVLLHLPLEAAEVPAFEIAVAGQPAVIYPADDSLLEDACTLLAFVQEQEVQVDHQGHWSESSLSALNRRLLRPVSLDTFDAQKSGDALSLLLQMTEHLGWLEQAQSQLHLQVAPVRAWLQGTRAQQRHALWRAWKDDGDWNDLCRVPGLRCEGTWQHDSLTARRSVLKHLSRCEPGVWYMLHDFAHALKRVDPDFQRLDGDYHSWYIRDEISGRFLWGFEHWLEVEGALIAYILRGPAHWLGVVDIGHGPHEPRAADDEGPRSIIPATAFRLTPVGTRLLGMPAYETREAKVPRLEVCPDFRVVAPYGALCSHRFRLAYFTTWEASRPAFVHRITRRALQRARQLGIGSERVLSFLRSASNGDLPQNVLHALTCQEE